MEASRLMLVGAAFLPVMACIRRVPGRRTATWADVRVLVESVRRPESRCDAHPGGRLAASLALPQRAVQALLIGGAPAALSIAADCAPHMPSTTGSVPPPAHSAAPVDTPGSAPARRSSARLASGS